MFLLYYLINPSEVQTVQNMIYYSDESRTYIQPSIKIHLLDYLELYLDFLLKIGFYYTRKAIESNINILRVRFDRVWLAVFLSLYLRLF